MNLHDVLTTIRETAGEQDCDTSELTPHVIRLAASQIDDDRVSRLLRESADDMDRPVTLSDVRASLQQWGVR